jgi:hypothetical protein
MDQIDNLMSIWWQPNSNLATSVGPLEKLWMRFASSQTRLTTQAGRRCSCGVVDAPGCAKCLTHIPASSLTHISDRCTRFLLNLKDVRLTTGYADISTVGVARYADLTR